MNRSVALLLALLACTAGAAAVEINRASQAELESLKGVGPALSEAVLGERQRQPFADWADLLARVPGLGRRSARRLSDQGVTVDGQAYGPAPAPLRPPKP